MKPTTHYFPAGNDIDTVVHKNVQLSEVTVSDILDSDHLPLIFHLLDLVKTRYLSDPAENFTDLEQFQSLASKLSSPRIQINLGEEANKAACNITASIASGHRLSTSKITLLDLNNNLPGLDSLLKHKQRLRKLASNLGSSM
jgi:hypothetical protein